MAPKRTDKMKRFFPYDNTIKNGYTVYFRNCPLEEPFPLPEEYRPKARWDDEDVCFVNVKSKQFPDVVKMLGDAFICVRMQRSALMFNAKDNAEFHFNRDVLDYIKDWEVDGNSYSNAFEYFDKKTDETVMKIKKTFNLPKDGKVKDYLSQIEIFVYPKGLNRDSAKNTSKLCYNFFTFTRGGLKNQCFYQDVPFMKDYEYMALDTFSF
jgi:hypothetical protein